MLDLILEVAQLRDNLFPFVCPSLVGALRHGTVGVVDGLCLFGRVEVSQDELYKQDREDKG